jgi:hypothetical protein
MHSPEGATTRCLKERASSLIMIEPPVHPRKHRLLRLLTLAVALTLLTLGWLSWTAFRGYRLVTRQLPAISSMEEVRGQILLFDEVLTMSARMSAATGNPQWEARYRRFYPQLTQALKEAMRVEDSGNGIPEGVRDKIFTPFFTTKPLGKGTGQGLALARAVVVDKHGGTIRFESTEGVGTTFIIRLPLKG